MFEYSNIMCILTSMNLSLLKVFIGFSNDLQLTTKNRNCAAGILNELCYETQLISM